MTAVANLFRSNDTAGAAQSERRRWIALAVLCLGQLMMVLDSTIVNVALPSIQRDLHFTQSSLTWVIDGYLITFGGLLLLAGRLGDLVGRKRIFLSGLVLFTVASVLCGISTTQGMLIGFRLLQGAGGAVASSVILAIIVTEFPERAEQAKAMGLYAFVSAGGGSIGLLAGGALTQSLDWHWIFFVNVPIGIIAFVLGSALIEENEGIGLKGGVDVLGSILITAATMAGAFAIVKSSEYGIGSARTLGVGGASLVLLAAFLTWESRIENPIMPLRILKLRMLMGSSLVRGMLITGMFSAFFLGSLYLERVLGYNAIKTGLAFMPLTLSIAAMSMGGSSRLVGRFGPVPTLAGGLVAIIGGLLTLAGQGVGASYFPGLFIAFTLMGLGAGASFLPLLTIGMSDAPRRDAGLASGIVNVSVQLFGAIGLAALGTIATDHSKTLAGQGQNALSALTGGYHLAYLVAAVFVGVGIVAALLVLRNPVSPEAQESLEAELERIESVQASEPVAQAA
ncbi:MAG TPA: MFS transporter [Solirubrobacteraceae bacterium]|jgi:EmrB/QacA subfamily drug resistance transporter|nr:MFS transporter [Solirubrobacteraceae bacterium]